MPQHGQVAVAPAPGRRLRYAFRIVDDTFLVLFNAREDETEWRVPHERFGRRWRVMIDTETGFACHGAGAEVDASVPLPLEGRTVVVLQRRDEP